MPSVSTDSSGTIIAFLCVIIGSLTIINIPGFSLSFLLLIAALTVIDLDSKFTLVFIDLIMPLKTSLPQALVTVLISVPIISDEITDSGTSKSSSIGSILSSDVTISPGSKYSPILFNFKPVIPLKGAFIIFLYKLF